MRIGTPVPSMPRYIVGATGSSGGRWLDHAPLVLGDLAPERLGGTLDVLGRHVHAGQLPQQLVALLEADHRADPPNHARTPGDSDVRAKAQRRSRGQKPRRARVAVVVGARQRQRPSTLLKVLSRRPA